MQNVPTYTQDFETSVTSYLIISPLLENLILHMAKLCWERERKKCFNQNTNFFCTGRHVHTSNLQGKENSPVCLETTEIVTELTAAYACADQYPLVCPFKTTTVSTG